MVEEPINPQFKSQATRDPTIDKEYEYFVPNKKDFSETFNQPSFDGKYKIVEKKHCGNIKRGKDGNLVNHRRKVE